jgi:hypothetical protein
MSMPESDIAAYLRRLGLAAGPGGEPFTAEEAAALAKALDEAVRRPARWVRPGSAPGRDIRAAELAAARGRRQEARAAAAPPAQPDLSSPLDQAAVQMHEAFGALIRAGFTEDQAIRYLQGAG